MLEIIKVILLLLAGYCAARAQMEYRRKKEKQNERKIGGYTKEELIKQGKKDALAAAERSKRIRELELKIAARKTSLTGVTECPVSLIEELEEWKVELGVLKAPKTGCSTGG